MQTICELTCVFLHDIIEASRAVSKFKSEPHGKPERFLFCLKQVIDMDEIVFIHSVDCRSCVYEMRDAPKRKMERIIQDRKRCQKCKDCERLKEAENERSRE